MELIPKYKVGDIVDTPYHGRRKIKSCYFKETKYPGDVATWMYEIELMPKEKGNPAYSENYINAGLFMCQNSGLPFDE